jgi:cysteine synthase A
VLGHRLGISTIPQVFVGGEHVGGCTELFDAVRDGRLQERLRERGIRYDSSVEIDPYSLFPKWLQPRKSA